MIDFVCSPGEPISRAARISRPVCLSRSRDAMTGRARVATLVALALLLAGCSVFSSNVKFPSKAESVFHLFVGQCLNPPKNVVAEVSSLNVVSCHAPHTQQVFALVKDNAGDNYPGSKALITFANATCLQHFAAYVGIAYQRSSLFYTYLLPSVRSWSSGDRTITCVITTTGAKLQSSVKGSKL